MNADTAKPARAGPGGPEAALVVFCKRPAPGTAKQRLAAALGDEAALRIAQALLDCALEDAQAWPGPVVLSPAHAIDAPWARRLLRRPARVVAQPDGGLGERLEAVDRELRSGGLTHLIFIGSDAPGLDEGYYAAARRALEWHDVVLGPARDGGVTLMGARRSWPPLAGLPWSESTLAAGLERCCIDAGASVASLPRSYDVDTAQDLALAHEDLGGDSRAARRSLLRLLEPMTAGRAQ
jgi:hypothetical protein